MQNINKQKNALRKEYLAKRNSIESGKIENLSNLICSVILELPEYKHSEQVFLYYPIKNEVSPLSLIEKAVNEGKRVGFPKSNKGDFSLAFYSVNGENDFSLGAYSIPEPNTNERLLPNEKTLCIVPALLFSREFTRLGYGKGFYDRFLAEFKGTSIGLAISDFILDTLPKEKTDTPLDIIVSEKGAIYRDKEHLIKA